MKTTNIQPITRIEGRVLQFILDFYSETKKKHGAIMGLLPSTREIQRHFGWSSQTAAMNHLRNLTEKGYLVQVGEGKARAYLVSNNEVIVGE